MLALIHKISIATFSFRIAQKDRTLQREATLRLLSEEAQLAPNRLPQRDPGHLRRPGPLRILVQAWSPEREAMYPSPMNREA